MSSEITKTNVNVCSNTKLVEKQKQIKAELGTLQAEKILSVSAVPHISSKKAEQDKIYVEGYVYYTVLYSAENSACETMSYKADFSDQIDIAGMSPNTNFIISTQLLEVEPKPIKDDGILVANTVINLRTCAVFTENIDCVNIEENSENLCTKMDETTLSSVLNAGVKNFEIGNRIELGKNFKRLINTSPTLASVDFY